MDMTPICLPSISDLRARTRSLAMLDAILCPEWEYRYVSFDQAWAPGMHMASMRNGCGDDWFLLFDRAGAALKGFAHELSDKHVGAMLQAQVPGAFSAFLNEPAFSMQDATFCYWRGADEASWHKVQGGREDDGAGDMLSLLVAGPSAYKAWAEAYFEVPVDLDTVSAVFGHVPLGDAMIRKLNPDADVDAAYADAAGIGYPRRTA